jgi:membrane protein required for colicin V production
VPLIPPGGNLLEAHYGNGESGMKFIEAYNLIDLFILGTILVTLILGIWKGFVRSLTALASVVLGVLIALKYHQAVQPYLSKISSLDPQISMILSMIIVFVAVQALFVLIRRILDALIDLTRLSWLDRCLGAVMGVAAGFLLVAGVVQTVLIAVPDWPMVKTSKLVRPVDGLTAKLMAHAPEQVRNQMDSFFTKWKGTSEPTPSTPAPRSAANKAPATSPGPVK